MDLSFRLTSIETYSITTSHNNKSVHAAEKARLLATGSLHSGDWLHAPPIASVGLRLSVEAVRVLTDLDARPVNRTPAYVEKPWMLGVYMVCPVAGAGPDTSAIIT